MQRRLKPEDLHTDVEYAMLKEMGDAGWSLVYGTQDASRFYYYFQREIEVAIGEGQNLETK